MENPQNTEQRILVVDDEAINRWILKDLFGMHGIVVDEAANGMEAVSLSHQTRYHLILMDIQMPILDGITATSRIRASAQNGQTPIIGVTACDVPEVHRQALLAGMNHLELKPFNPARLLAYLAGYQHTKDRQG